MLAAHQPHFLPWLGYLDKVSRADLFVIVDHVQFERQNFQNRTRVPTRDGVRWATVPVLQRSRDELIRDKLIDNKRDGRTTWGERVFQTLRHAYLGAPYFAAYEDLFQELLTRPWERLVELNDALFRYLLEEFAIKTPIVRSSDLSGVSGARSDMIIAMCKATSATVYLSGSGASRRYLDCTMLEQGGVKVIWQEFEHPLYPQVHAPGSFVPGLSAVDLLFHRGPDSAAVLRGESAWAREWRGARA